MDDGTASDFGDCHQIVACPLLPPSDLLFPGTLALTRKDTNQPGETSAWCEELKPPSQPCGHTILEVASPAASGPSDGAALADPQLPPPETPETGPGP